MKLYRWSTDAEEQDGRHTSPGDWVRVYDDYGEFSGLLVPVEREIYVTTCDNHSGGPASPHVLGCFKELAGIGETP